MSFEITSSLARATAVFAVIFAPGHCYEFSRTFDSIDIYNYINNLNLPRKITNTLLNESDILSILNNESLKNVLTDRCRNSIQFISHRPRSPGLTSRIRVYNSISFKSALQKY